MMKIKKLRKTDPLADLLKAELIEDIPSAQFSDKLLQMSMTSYQISYSTKYKKEERLGKTILSILIFFNLMMLYLLKPFAVDPVWLLIFLPFMIGLAILVRMNIRVAKASNDSGSCVQINRSSYKNIL